MTADQVNAMRLPESNLVQIKDDSKNEIKDPKVDAIKAKKRALKAQIEEKTEEKPLSEDEEKAKLDGEIAVLAKTADKNAHVKKLAKLEKKAIEDIKDDKDADPKLAEKIEAEKE